MHSYLITGSTINARVKKAGKLIGDFGIEKLENNPDVLRLRGENSIGIEKVREVQAFLSKKAYGEKNKIVFIPEAEKLTLQAQNAFLKTLEEPPASSVIILCAPTGDDLLPTIQSRCEIVNVIANFSSRQNKRRINSATTEAAIAKFISRFDNELDLLKKLLNSKPGGRIKLVEPYVKNREEALAFCNKIIEVLRIILLYRYRGDEDDRKDMGDEIGQIISKTNISDLLKKFRKTKALLQKNINVKLAINNLVIGLL